LDPLYKRELSSFSLTILPPLVTLLCISSLCITFYFPSVERVLGSFVF
jgi:hypothetical protein